MGYGRSVVGVHPLTASVAGGGAASTVQLAAVNNAASFRFEGLDARPFYGIWINWAAVTVPGTVRFRIETDSGGKPSGTLYDANATIDFTPAVGWQQLTFATPPTTAPTAGALYHLVLITTVAGTSHGLRGYWGPTGGAYPLNCLTATDGSTRTNFAESSNSVPIATVVLSDGTEETFGMAGFATSSNFQIYGSRAVAMKYVVPTGVTESLLGVVLEQPLRGTTPDDLRCRILDSTNTVVSGSTAIIPAASLLGASGRRIIFRFPAAVSLVAGTYRVAIDQSSGGGASSSTSGNYWAFYNASYRTAALAPSYCTLSTTTSDTGTITWTDTTTDTPLIGVQLNDLAGTGGGGGTYTDPGIANVRSGTAYTYNSSSQTGTLIVPSAANVLTGTTFDATTAGTATVPTAAQTLITVTYGAGGNALTGTVTLPAVGKVRSGQTFGASLGQAGTDVSPAASNVLSGVGYGASGTEFTGTASSGSGPSAAAIATAVWQDLISGSDFNTAGSAGAIIKASLTSAGSLISPGTGTGQINLASGVVASNVIQVNGTAAGSSDGTAQGGTTTSITLASTASSVTDFYKKYRVLIVGGTGVGQWAFVTGYNGTSKVATLDRTLATPPDVTSQYTLDPPVGANVEEVAGQTANASAPVAFPSSIGTSNYTGGAVASVTAPVTVNAINGLAPPANWATMSIDSSGRVLLQPAQTGVTIPTVTTVTTTTNLTNAPAYNGPSVGTIQAGLATLTNQSAILTAIGTPAQANQIPANFTTSTFASAGVFATAALANAPAGGGGSSYTPSQISAVVTPAVVQAMATAPVGAAASVTAPVTVGSNNDKSGYSLNLSQVGLTPRPLDAIPDSQFNIGDAFVAAISGAAGKESVSGTSYQIKTPSTGTVIRTFTLDSSTTPTQRN